MPGRPPASEWIRPHDDAYFGAMGASRAHLKPGLVTYAEGMVAPGRAGRATKSQAGSD